MNCTQHYLLENAMIIDVEKECIFNGTIEIKDGKINQIYSESNIEIEGIKVFDLEGKYVIPGLIDMHCHIKEGFAPQFLASGVTTVRNTAGNVMELKNLTVLQQKSPSSSA